MNCAAVRGCIHLSLLLCALQRIQRRPQSGGRRRSGSETARRRRSLSSGYGKRMRCGCSGGNGLGGDFQGGVVVVVAVGIVAAETGTAGVSVRVNNTSGEWCRRHCYGAVPDGGPCTLASCAFSWQHKTDGRAERHQVALSRPVPLRLPCATRPAPPPLKLPPLHPRPALCANTGQDAQAGGAQGEQGGA